MTPAPAMPVQESSLWDLLRLEYVQTQEHHQTVHQYPEDGERHRLAHDVAVLTLHVAGGGGNGDTLRREQLATLRTGTVGSGQPVGLATGLYLCRHSPNLCCRGSGL